MLMIECEFSNILERDMDMLLLEEIVSSEEFLQIFLSKIGIADANIFFVEHSKKDNELGESDLTVLFEHRTEKIALLIEDKIDATAQPEQASRYIDRGDKGLADGNYDKYYIFIVAPKEYLDTNEEARKYPYSISYEEILNYYKSRDDNRSAFKASQIERAIKKKEKGYQPVVNDGVSDFWEKYVAYQQNYYPELMLASSAGKKGSAATWPRFRTNIRGLYILHKSEKGYIDLTFESAKDRISEIDELIKSTFGGYEEIGISIVITSKSVALRMVAPILDFKLPFEEQRSKVEGCFTVIKSMADLAKRLDTVKVINILGDNI